MNLADALRNILRNKNHLFTQYWKEDVMFVGKELKRDVQKALKSGKSALHHLKKDGVKFNFKDTLDSATDTVLVFKLLPKRVSEGVQYFKDDFLLELDSLEDTKQKTIFSLKVIGALTSYSISTIYQVRKGNINLTLPGLRKKSAFTNFIVAELLFRLSYLFVQRFLVEIEKNVTNEEELEHIRYFRQLLSDRQEVDLPQEEPEDRAIEIVEALKHFILNGERF